MCVSALVPGFNSLQGRVPDRDTKVRVRAESFAEKPDLVATAFAFSAVGIEFQPAANAAEREGGRARRAHRQ